METCVVCFHQKPFRDNVRTVGQEIAFNGLQKRILCGTFSLWTHMQTFSAFSRSIYDFFCHLNSRCFAKPYPEMGVCYLMRGCPITGFSIRESCESVKRQRLQEKCSYLVLSMFVSVPRSVGHRKPSSPRFSL